jgi:hypothetical protein
MRPAVCPIRSLQAIFLLCAFFVSHWSLAQSLFDITARGMSCRSLSDSSLFCKYEIGNDLEFSITSVGREDAGISFLRSNIEGDYWARFGVMHGCIIVMQGEKTASRTKHAEYTFVSPKNGGAYQTWQECKSAR